MVAVATHVDHTPRTPLRRLAAKTRPPHPPVHVPRDGRRSCVIACHSVTLPSTRNWGHEGPGVAVATLPALSIFRDDDRAGDFPRPMTPTRGNQRPRSMTLTRGNRRPWPPVVCGGTTMPVPPWAVFRGAGARTLAALFVVPAVGAASTHTMLHGRLFCHQEATGFAVIAMPRNPRVHVRSCRWSSGVWSGGLLSGRGGWRMASGRGRGLDQHRAAEGRWRRCCGSVTVGSFLFIMSPGFPSCLFSLPCPAPQQSPSESEFLRALDHCLAPTPALHLASVISTTQHLQPLNDPTNTSNHGFQWLWT